MKFYLSLLAFLCLASTPFIAPVIASETKIVAQASAINPYIKENIAPKISVKIDSGENGGSGVIIAQQDNTYLILTNAHVLGEDNSFTIYTHDGETHQAKEIANSIETEDDLALLEFTSNNSYEIADINSAATPQVNQSILAVGYSAETGKLVTQEEAIKKVPNKTLKDGYQIGYSADVVQGMSGGAILNTDGEVIGINGKSAFPILDTGYVYQDGSEISTEEVEQLRKLSWGLSINRLLAQVNLDVITAYNLPLPETTGEIKTTYTGWIGDLETKAKKITVRIDSTSGGNGSGVIIAQSGNTYTVLTADHVICEKDEKTRECIGYDYTIITPDGKSQTLDPQTIKAQPGVDLAVFQFVSNENYEVAELADYPLQDSEAVFVAGYPRLGNNPQWQFSLGFGLEKERGLLTVNINNDNQFSDGFDSVISQSNPVSAYEMVYTSITYGGMSGGALLDREGRVIGIHGLTEGETAINSQDALSQGKKIQLGYSLGVPIKTFIGLKEQLEIRSTLSIQSNRPQALNTDKQSVLANAILGTEISDQNATPERWLERGNNFWRLKRYKEALRAFDRVIDLKPEFIYLAYYGKSLSLAEQGKVEIALSSLKKATSIQPNFVPAFVMKSVVLRELNRGKEALAAMESAIQLQPNNANLHNQYGFNLLDLDRYPEAEEAYTKAIQLDDRSAFYVNRGHLYYKRGEKELALTDYNKAIKINPQFSNAYLGRGNIYDILGEKELALTDYNKAIKINPQFSNIYGVRGIFYAEFGNKELALADLNQAIKINPEDANNYGTRGRIYAEFGNKELALADYNKAIKINPQYAIAYYARSIIYSDLGGKELALADLNQAIKINPQYAIAYVSRGFVYYDKGERELALADFSEAIKINPQFAAAYFGRSALYSELGEKALAIVDLSQAIKINPEDADAYVGRGLVYYEKGERELALDDFSEAIKINPEDADAYYSRGRIYSESGEKELALSDLQKAQKLFNAQNNPVRIEDVANLLQELTTESTYSTSELVVQNSPQSAEEYYIRGFTYHKQSETELAIADYTKAIQINPQMAKAYYSRGNLYKASGEKELALADYNEAIKINPQFVEVYINRGGLHEEKGEIDLALVDYNEVIKINPQSAHAYAFLGLIYDQKGNIEAAQTNLEKAQQLFVAQGKTALAEKTGNILQTLTTKEKPESTDSNFELAGENNLQSAEEYASHGLILLKKEEVDLALAKFNEAIKINSQYADAYLARGTIYYEKGEKKLALVDLQKAQQLFIAQNNTEGTKVVANLLQQLTTESINSNSEQTGQSNPQSAEEYYNRGFAYHKQSEDDLAIADYTQAIKLDSNNEKALINRGLLYAKQGKDELALADYTQAIKVNPNHSGSYRNRGVLYFEQGEYELAKADWDKAIEVNPEDAQAYYNRGLFNQKLGDDASARADLEKAYQLAIAQNNDTLAQKIVSILER